MKSENKLVAVVLSSVMIAWSLGPTPAVAQTTQPSGVRIHTQLPRNNVTGGTIASGRPGALIQSAIVTHSRRQASSLHAFGGATITAAPDPSFRDRVLPNLVAIFLGAVNAVALAIQAAITGATTGT